MSDVEVVDLELRSPVSTRCVARTEGTDRSVEFFTDKPHEKGGTDEGPMSSELLGAAVASCHMTTAKKVADKRKVPFSRLQCRALIHFEGDQIERLELVFKVESDASQGDWETVMRLAAKACTVGRAVRVPIDHTIQIVP